MKLCDIYETMLAGKHPEFTALEIKTAVRWLKDGGVSIPLENNKFELIRKDNSFGLFRQRDGAVLGCVLLGKQATLYGVECYPLVNVQILPQFRNSVAAWLLINGVRGVLNLPVVVDNTLFVGGQQLLVAMAKRASMPHVSVIDKKSGNIRPFDSADITINDNTAFMLECGVDNIAVECAYPGGTIQHTPDWLVGLTLDIE